MRFPPAGRQSPGHDVGVHPLQFFVGRDAQFLAKSLHEPPIPRNRDVTLALESRQPHQTQVSLLVGWIDFDQPLQRGDRSSVVAARFAVDALVEQKADHARAHLGAAQFGPLVKAVFWKKIAIQRERLFGVAVCRRRLECVEVDP
jgi:hypothetical protein